MPTKRPTTAANKGGIADKFIGSLEAWGGTQSLGTDRPSNLTLPENPSAKFGWTPPEFKSQPEAWRDLAPVLEAFTNAYLIQEVQRIIGGPGDVFSMAATIKDPPAILFFLALVIVARDNHARVLVEWVEPGRDSGWLVPLSASRHSVLNIEIRPIVSDYDVDFRLRFFGTENRRRSGGSVEWELVEVDDWVVVVCNRDPSVPRPNEKLEGDMFLQEIGYPLYHFSAADILQDAFGCAAQVFKKLAGYEFCVDSRDL